ncbi:hypothetical protein pb186bvf_018221 [Paramecium bursaria]
MEYQQQLSQKLTVIIDKLRKDIDKVNSDKLQQVFHSVHTISWIVIQSIAPYVDELFRAQTIQVFQLVTQLLKFIKETDLEEVDQKMFQLKAQRRRSLKLIDCSMCGEYKKLAPKNQSSTSYARYMEQIKREGLKESPKKQIQDPIQQVREIPPFIKSVGTQYQPVESYETACQTDPIEQDVVLQNQEQIQQIISSLPEHAREELKDHFINYYQLVEQNQNLQLIIETAQKECQNQINLIKNTQPNLHILQLKFLSQQSIDEIYQILMSKKIDLPVTNDFKDELLKDNLPLSEFQKQAQILEYQRKAIDAGIIEYDPEYDPALLDGMRIEFRIRVIDGQTVIEEIVIDKATGLIVRSRIRKQQPLDGDLKDLIKPVQDQSEKLTDDNQWIFDKYGQKVKILEKQNNFTSYEVQTDPSKKKIKVTKAKDEPLKVEEEWQTQQKDGQHDHRVYQTLGAMVYEDKIDTKVNRWQTKIIDNKEVIQEEIITENGVTIRILEKEKYGQDVIRVIQKNNKNQIINQTTKQVLKDDDGDMFQQEEEVKQDGQKIVRKIYLEQEEGCQKITETTQLPNGQKQIMNIKKYKDKTEIAYLDEYGDDIRVTKYQYINDKGQVVQCEKKVNQRTKEQSISKQYQNEDGKVTVETQVLLDGKEISNVLIVHLSPTERIEKITKGNKVIEQKIVVDASGSEQVQTIDKDAKVSIQKTSFVKDSVEYQEQVIQLPNGAKRQIQQKTYFDSNNEKIIEEERTDEFGQKTIIRKRVSVLGEEIVEEFQIQETDDQKLVKKIRTIERRAPRNDLIELELADGQTQTEDYKFEQPPIVEQFVDQTKTQDQFNPMRKPPQQVVVINPDFEQLDQEVFKRYQQKKKDPQFSEAVLLIKKYFNKTDNEELKQEEFQEYLQKFRSNHNKCGEQCSHLMRFYAKLGFLIQKSAMNRQPLKMQKVHLHAKEQD